MLFKIKGNGAQVFYKPHPSEINSYGINSLVDNVSNCDNLDVFIGFSSSLLKDMSSRHKLSIQVASAKVIADNFEFNGYCLSIDDGEGLPKKIMDILNGEIKVPCISDKSLMSLLK